MLTGKNAIPSGCSNSSCEIYQKIYIPNSEMWYCNNIKIDILE